MAEGALLTAGSSLALKRHWSDGWAERLAAVLLGGLSCCAWPGAAVNACMLQSLARHCTALAATHSGLRRYTLVLTLDSSQGRSPDKVQIQDIVRQHVPGASLLRTAAAELVWGPHALPCSQPSVCCLCASLLAAAGAARSGAGLPASRTA